MSVDSDVLFAPDPEAVAATNAWAFLRWIAATRAAPARDWDGLVAWLATDAGAAAAQWLWGDRFAWLLFADIRPADRVVCAPDPAATVLIAPEAVIAAALDDSRFGVGLRVCVALGGPMADANRRRLVARAPGGMMLLGVGEGAAWGDPLSPVLARPEARRALQFLGHEDPTRAGWVARNVAEHAPAVPLVKTGRLEADRVEHGGAAAASPTFLLGKPKDATAQASASEPLGKEK